MMLTQIKIPNSLSLVVTGRNFSAREYDYPFIIRWWRQHCLIKLCHCFLKLSEEAKFDACTCWSTNIISCVAIYRKPNLVLCNLEQETFVPPCDFKDQVRYLVHSVGHNCVVLRFQRKPISTSFSLWYYIMSKRPKLVSDIL